MSEWERAEGSGVSTGGRSISERDQQHALALETLRACTGKFVLISEKEDGSVSLVGSFNIAGATEEEAFATAMEFVDKCAAGLEITRRDLGGSSPP